jgi:crotonobetainyl-CoA:carnitine CoA-transferase CaiB-like acyl-CoA transferase
MSSSPDAPAPPVSPLGGVLVVDLSTSVAGQYAGRMLAMYGAAVVLVEPPAGSPTRRLSPMDGDTSFLFRHLNQGKRSVVVTPGSYVLADLLDRADVVIRDQDAAVDVPESVVDCAVGDFPPDGPYADWQGGEMVQQALVGVMQATGAVDRQPVYGLGRRASYATGTTAYTSIVAALHERRRSGRGQRVRASVFESAGGMAQNLVSQYSYNGTFETRARYPGFLAVLRCVDAWIVLFAIRNWPTVCRVFGCEDLMSDPRLTTSGERMAHWPEVVAVLQERAQDMVADHVVAGLQAGRVSAEKVISLGELVESPQWRVRAMLTEVGSGPDREVALRRLFDIAGTATGVAGPSPRLGGAA